MSMVDLLAKHKDRDVWTVTWENDRRNPSKPYFNLFAPEPPR